MATGVQSLPNAANITRVVLPNGIVVLVYENFAAQSVVISGSLNAGSIFEPFEKSGLASLTAGALLRGTKTRDFSTLATIQEDIGADVNIGGGTFKVSFSGKALAEDLGVILDVLADALRNPVFPEQQVERLRAEVITGLKMREQDTRSRANRAFTQALFPVHHPFHYPRSGSLQSVPSITLDDLRAFHARHYGPRGMILAISGAVKADDAVALVERWFADWENAAQPEMPALPEFSPPERITRAQVALAGKTQSDIVMGVPGPSRLSPDYQAAMLANSILGQFGMMGRIGNVVREKLGLAYYAYSAMEGGFGPGPWTIAAGVNPANVELAIERSLEEVRRIASEPVSAADLADNQSYTVGRLPLQLESNEGLVSTILNMEMYGLGLDYLVDYRDKVYSHTPDTLLAVTQKYLDADRFVIGIAGPG
jgi:zinc protease